MKIFRGESLVSDNRVCEDRQSRVMSIRECLATSNELPSKMLIRGNPYSIFRSGLEKKVVEHVSEVYEQKLLLDESHFISFSASEKIAKRFAMNNNSLSSDAVSTGYKVYKNMTDDEKIDMEFLIASLDISKKEKAEAVNGLYNLRYAYGKKLLIINSLEYIQSIEGTHGSQIGFEQAKKYAKDEEEWLVLPVDRLRNVSSLNSFTAMIDLYAEEINCDYWIKPDCEANSRC